MTADLDGSNNPSRAKRLKAATNRQHHRLDHSIMAGRPFESVARYGLFLKIQHQFHRDIDALYDDATLDKLLPDLAGRRRLSRIAQDLADLGIEAPVSAAAPVFGAGDGLELPVTLGWLYVAEGSNLGAAFLLKEATKLGLSETSGARHLAAAPEGRGLHWKTFTAALDSLTLINPLEDRVVTGAQAAFGRVRQLVDETFGEGRATLGPYTVSPH